MSTMINQKLSPLYQLCISHLDKKKQKYLLKRFNYLCEMDCYCLPLTKTISTIAMSAMSAFLSKYTSKENPRNTVSDILVLATAADKQLTLETRDKPS